METSGKRWFVMRDLKRRNSSSLAVHELANAGFEVFTPLTQMIMTIGGRRQRREVPVIQDLLFIHETREALDPLVARCRTLQYRYVSGHRQNEPMIVRDKEMNQFILAVTSTKTPVYYRPGELTNMMYGKKIRIVGGMLDGFEGRLLSVKGMRKRRLIVEIPGLITAAIEVEADYLQVIR